MPAKRTLVMRHMPHGLPGECLLWAIYHYGDGALERFPD